MSITKLSLIITTLILITACTTSTQQDKPLFVFSPAEQLSLYQQENPHVDAHKLLQNNWVMGKNVSFVSHPVNDSMNYNSYLYSLYPKTACISKEVNNNKDYKDPYYGAVVQCYKKGNFDSSMRIMVVYHSYYPPNSTFASTKFQYEELTDANSKIMTYVQKNCPSRNIKILSQNANSIVWQREPYTCNGVVMPALHFIDSPGDARMPHSLFTITKEMKTDTGVYEIIYTDFNSQLTEQQKLQAQKTIEMITIADPHRSTKAS